MSEINVNETDLGDYLKRNIQERHWSIRKAAMKMDMDASYISRIINHKAIANPKSESLDKMAKGLNVPRHDVYAAMDRSIAPDDDVTAVVSSTFDIGKAIDNDEYMTNHGKQLTDKEKAMLKALFGE